MFVASKKKKENIAEYILYMWQIEDIIRAYKFDMDLIQSNIIDKFDLTEDKRKRLREWYESLIDMMRTENVQQSGHLQLNKNTIIDLTDLHKQLLYSMRYPDYTSAFYNALPFIAELRAKENAKDGSDVEVCFTFLYGILILNLQKKEISGPTAKAQSAIIKFINNLSSKYIKYKNNELDLD
jgi:hypothetical protein